MTDLTPEKRAELRRLAEACIAAIGPVGTSTAPFVRALWTFQEEALPETVLSLLDALDAREAELAGLKSALRKFAPSKLDPLRCRNCEEPRHEHYSGPFAEPDTVYCSKYFVPTGPR